FKERLQKKGFPEKVVNSARENGEYIDVTV
ncbi:hypothetical protein GGR21_004032, partial [Dysgonomonas hofstadii]|nr:hypothetical protein [Dysgonomonas hofstadii]MBB4038103.1 hypothetical protein [Dysgonomonas hofstadii]